MELGDGSLADDVGFDPEAFTRQLKEDSFKRYLCHESPAWLVFWWEYRDQTGFAHPSLPKGHKDAYVARHAARPKREPNMTGDDWKRVWEQYKLVDDECGKRFDGLHANARRELHAEVIAERTAYRQALDERARVAYIWALGNCDEQWPWTRGAGGGSTLAELLGGGGSARAREYIETMLELVCEHGAEPGAECAVLALAPLLPSLSDADVARLVLTMQYDTGEGGDDVYWHEFQRLLISWLDVDGGAHVVRVVRAFEARCVGSQPPRHAKDYWRCTGHVMDALSKVVEAEIPHAWLRSPWHDLWWNRPASTRDDRHSADACVMCGAEPATSPGLVLMECVRCRDGVFCSRDCQRAARKNGKHPRDCAEFRPEPSQVRAAVVRLSAAMVRLCRYVVQRRIATDTENLGGNFLGDVGMCISALWELRAVEAHFEVAAGFDCDAICVSHCGNYSDWLRKTGLPHVLADRNIVPHTNIFYHTSWSESEIRRREAAAQANSRKLIKKHQQLSKVALESTRFARQLEPIAQLAHALSADVSSVFRAAWGAAARLPPIPPSAKPLDFPLAEKGVVLVVD